MNLEAIKNDINIVIEAIYNNDKEDAVTMLKEMQNELIILNELYN